ncbi:MAG: hypothetical protein KAS16_05190 [Thermoplasmata archaeon]|nr:hypothetical protein [Thermoplasmata archaeon]
MPGELFDEMVKVIETSISIEDPKGLVEEQCSFIGKVPDELTSDDGSFLVLSIMTNLGDSITKEEWEKLDAGFKELLSEEVKIHGKVRGGIIKGIMQYYSFKKGQKGLELLEIRTHRSTKFRNDSWYPATILGDLLVSIDDMYGAEYSRSKEIGEYIILNNHILPIFHWFNRENNEQEIALKNLQELLLLDDFKVDSNNGNCNFSFTGLNTHQLQQFILGMCNGILKLRECNGNGNSIKVEESEEGVLNYSFKTEEKTSESRGWA